MEILWGRLSGGNRQLTLDDFFWCYRPQHIISTQGIYHFAARKKALRLVSDMLDFNRNWMGKYFFVKRTDWVCRPEEWDTMSHGFDNTWGIVKDLGLMLSIFSYPFSRMFFVLFCKCFNVVIIFSILASIRPSITDEQEAFIQQVIEIPFEQCKCRDLLTLDTLRANCDGPEPTLAARRLNTYSRRREYNFPHRFFPFSFSF